MIKIYHNPRCRKSREGLALVEKSAQPYEIIRYLEEPLSRSDLQQLLKTLDMRAIELVRKQEPVWKSDFKDRDLTEDQIIEAMLNHPKLIERPIVVSKGKGVIGRPPEKILDILG